MSDYIKYMIVRDIAENNGGGSSGGGGGCVTALAVFFGAIFIFLSLITSEQGLVFISLVVLVLIATLIHKAWKALISDKQVFQTFIVILLFSFLFICGIFTIQYFSENSPSAIEKKSNEIMDMVTSGNYNQAFKLAERYFPDYPENQKWREKIKFNMPQKMRLEQFPEDYIKLVVVADETRINENGHWQKYFYVEKLIYSNTSDYDVKVTNLCYYDRSGITYYILNETLKRNTSKGNDTYTDGEYSTHNSFLVKNGVVESVSYEFKILE